MGDESLERQIRLVIEAVGAYRSRHEYGTTHTGQLLERLLTEGKVLPSNLTDDIQATADVPDTVERNKADALLGLLFLVETLMRMRELEQGSTPAETLRLIRETSYKPSSPG